MVEGACLGVTYVCSEGNYFDMLWGGGHKKTRLQDFIELVGPIRFDVINSCCT